jgi:hypothetical protein
MLQYSFLKHPIQNLIEYLKYDVEGIKNAYGIFCNYEKRLNLIELSANSINYVSISKKIALLQKFRNQAIHLSWINSEMLSFVNKNELQIQQLKLEDEVANSWLVLKFVSPIDHQHDVLIVEISGIHCFGLTKSSNPVNSTDKALIGNIFNVMLSSKLKTDYNNFKTLQLVNQSYDSQLKKIDELENQNKSIIENASKTIQLFIDSLKRKWEIKLSLKIEIAQDIIKDIIELNQNIHFIENTFEKAVLIAYNTSMLKNGKIILKRNHFAWDSYKSESSNTKLFSKHSNILEFLDRYELATKIVLNKGWKINGNTVGKCCDPSVSPASITFNLKKYAQNVRDLVQQYENRWPNLILHFRPLQNIINSDLNESEALSA